MFKTDDSYWRKTLIDDLIIAGTKRAISLNMMMFNLPDIIFECHVENKSIATQTLEHQPALAIAFYRL